MFHANGQFDGQTDIMKLLVISHNFSKTPKKQASSIPVNIRTCVIVF
jgi:hypothetical protein